MAKYKPIVGKVSSPKCFITRQITSHVQK